MEGAAMTTVKRVPAGGVAVIGPISEKTKSRLTQAVSGTFAKVSEAPLTHVLETECSDLRALSDQINKVVGAEGVVAPLLTDDDGNVLFPTGSLQVRFKDQPSDDQLSSFAKRHKITLKQRNKWAPMQAEFTVGSDDLRYFPDIAAEVSSDDYVTNAWPDVRAAYRREGR
jgi:hypothetical protein